MEDDVSRELTLKLESYIHEFSKSSDTELNYRREILNQQTRDMIEAYSNSIKNIGTISGVVAPFSLSLLTITSKLEINVNYLVLGFVLLLGNIIFSHLIFHSKLDIKSRKLNEAELEWVSASINKDIIHDKTREIGGRVEKMSEFVTNTLKLDALLGLKALDNDLLELSLNFQKYHRWVNEIFAVGSGCIILSTFYNPMVAFLSTLVQAIMSS